MIRMASGDDGVEETLLPIPNRKVKLYSADGTARGTVWKSRTLPGNMQVSYIGNTPAFQAGKVGSIPTTCSNTWGYSSVGRAPALQAGGQGFESLYLH